MASLTIPDTALQQLEFQRALDCVARFAAGDLGAAAVRRRRPRADLAEIARDLREVDQLADLLRAGDPFRAVPVADIRDQLGRLAVAGSVLDAADLLAIANTIEASRTVVADLTRIADEAPFAGDYVVAIPPRTVEAAIRRAIAPDGSVNDDASPELAKARRQVRATRDRLIGLMESLLRSFAAHERPADATVTVRNGRYVVPVSREARSRVAGIVHGESGTGATLFVEPAPAVELGNELREWEARESRAVLEVFRTLTASVRECAVALRAGWRMCVAVDDLGARAAYAVACAGHQPAMADAPATLVLREARHPVLLADGVAVVPFSLDLGGDATALVLSGPNAGGKTVLLKAAGLVCLLAQAGIVPPVGPGTQLPVFLSVFTDIGDRQSIAESLSTYSAHLGALRDIVTGADAASLVLVDEFGTGTDPAEGAALASAILLELARRGALTLVTTHLNPLKELASSAGGILNGSLRFDDAAMRSTFELVVGIPGRSYGLTIARQLGMPDTLIAAAEALVPQADRDVEALLADLNSRDAQVQERERSLASEAAELARRMDLLARNEAEVARREAAVRTAEREADVEARQQARKYMLEARRTVEEALQRATAAADDAAAREARRVVERGIQEQARAIDDIAEVMKAKGWRVKGLGAAEPPEDSTGRRGAVKIGNAGSSSVENVTLDVTSEIDLRGLREADAEYEFVRALDAAIAADLGVLRVIHGKGTGALQAMVHRILKRDRRVARFAFAPGPQGGTGVTVVETAS